MVESPIVEQQNRAGFESSFLLGTSVTINCLHALRLCKSFPPGEWVILVTRPGGLTYLNLEHFMFLVIVVLSTRKFEVAGGVSTALLMWLVMVIHDMGLQPIMADTVLALAFTLIIGVSTAWLVGTYVKTKTMEEKIILQLRSAIEKGEWMEARLKETCDVQTKLRYELKKR